MPPEGCGCGALSVLELGGWLERLFLRHLSVPFICSPRLASAVSVMIELTTLPLGPVVSTEF